MQRYAVSLLVLTFLVWLPAGGAFADSLDIDTSDFATLFGSGALLTLPSSLGGGSEGSTDLASSGTDGTAGYAVWQRTSDGLLVFVYDLHLHGGSNAVTQFEVSNPFGVSTVAFPTDFATSVVELGTDTGIGYVTETGQAPSAATAPGGISGPGYRWTFLDSFFNATLTAGEGSVRLVAVFDVGGVVVGTGTLLDTGSEGSGSVPVPGPEPGTLLLIGSGLVGMGLAGRKKLLSRILT